MVAAALGGRARPGRHLRLRRRLLYDLVLDTPFGLSALTYAVVGYGVGLVGAPSAGQRVVAGAVAAAAALMPAALYTSVGHLIGAPYPFGAAAGHRLHGGGGTRRFWSCRVMA